MKRIKLSTLFTTAILSCIISTGSAQGPNSIRGTHSPGTDVTVGYSSDYIFYGARLAQDSGWIDVSYCFEGLPLAVTVGAFYLTSFGPDAGSGTNASRLAGALAGTFGDQADLYARVCLPEIMGIESTLGYTAYTYPTPTYGASSGSTHEVSIELCRELACGLNAFVRIAHDFNERGFQNTPPPLPNAFGPFLPPNEQIPKEGQEGAWIYEVGLNKCICISDCIKLNVGGGVLYTDNYWFDEAGISDSGWNNYYLSADLPISLDCGATLTPYVGYNGTPDGWVLDGSKSGYGANQTHWGQNANDVLHWGVSLSVEF